MNIVLKGVSLKGRNRIREHGEVWEVSREGLFQGHSALLVQSVETQDWRWVLLKNDPNFEIEGLGDYTAPMENHCPRVVRRMECLECGYPISEAMLPWDGITPHVETHEL